MAGSLLIPTCQQPNAARATDTRRDIAIGESHTSGDDRVHVGCRRELATVATRLRVSHVVNVEDDDVRLRLLCRR